jgi:hypothetical protein
MDSRLESWRSRQIQFLKPPDCDKNDSGFSIVDICALSQAMLASLIRANAQASLQLRTGGVSQFFTTFPILCYVLSAETHTGEVADVSPNENRITNPNYKTN